MQADAPQPAPPPHCFHCHLFCCCCQGLSVNLSTSFCLLCQQQGLVLCAWCPAQLVCVSPHLLVLCAWCPDVVCQSRPTSIAIKNILANEASRLAGRIHLADMLTHSLFSPHQSSQLGKTIPASGFLALMIFNTEDIAKL